MTSKIEELEKNVKKITIEIEKEKFEEGLEHSFNKNKKRFKVNGFRPGTAPRNLVENTYGVEVLYDDAIDFVMGPAYVEALKEHSVDPVAMPEVEISQIGKDQNLIFTAKVTTRPDVELGKYKGIKVGKLDVKVTDEEIEDRIKKDAEKNARIITVEDRPAKLDDTLNIDFEGSIDGVLFEGGSAKGFDLILGSNSFIDTFEDQLVGKNVGEEVIVKVNFPADYGKEELNGKAAEFKVNINSITEKVLPEINDELAQDVSEFDTLAEYKEDLKNKIKAEKEKREKVEIENKMLEEVADGAKVEIPEVMIDNQVQGMINQFARNLQMQGMNIDDFIKYTGGNIDELKSHYRADAEKELKIALVLDKIAKTEKIEATDEDVEKELENLSGRFGKSTEEIKAMMGNKIADVKDELVVDKTINFIRENAIEK